MPTPLNARLSYTIPTSPPTTKTIILPKPRFLASPIADPFIPKDIHVTLTGDQETVMLPRLDIRVQLTFGPFGNNSTNLDLRRQVHNWWQWAQQGNTFRLVFDSTKTVKTTLSGAEALGQTLLSVTSTSGFVVGQYYVIRSGANYQLIKVSSIDGIGLTITASEALDFNFPSGAVVRDQYLWDGVIRDPSLPTPIRDLFNPAEAGSWEFDLDFFEDVA